MGKCMWGTECNKGRRARMVVAAFALKNLRDKEDGGDAGGKVG